MATNKFSYLNSFYKKFIYIYICNFLLKNKIAQTQNFLKLIFE